MSELGHPEPEQVMLEHRLVTMHAAYALVNPLQIAKPDWQDLPATPLVPEMLQAQPHLMPLLVDLAAMAFEKKVALLERIALWRRRGVAYFAALLSCDGRSEVIASHLRNRLIARRPDGERNLLRFYDPRVFRHLRWLFSAEQMNLLLGPIAAWNWPDGDGVWRQHKRGEPMALTLRLDARHWETIDRLRLINRSLNDLEVRAPQLTQDDALAQRIDALLAEAQALHALHENDDRLLYAQQPLRFHPHIHRHPTLRARLQQVREHGGSYVEACADLDDAAMRVLAAELKDGPTEDA